MAGGRFEALKQMSAMVMGWVHRACNHATLVFRLSGNVGKLGLHKTSRFFHVCTG